MDEPSGWFQRGGWTTRRHEREVVAVGERQILELRRCGASCGISSAQLIAAELLQMSLAELCDRADAAGYRPRADGARARAAATA